MHTINQLLLAIICNIILNILKLHKGEVIIYKLLLVEDDPDISFLVESHLKSEGFDVTAAQDGEKALQYFNDSAFDLVLLDIMLPKVNGKEVLKTIRETSSVPILIISAKDSEIDRILGLELGADDYITKPFSVRELAARIHAALRRIGYYKNNEPEHQNNISMGPFTLNLETYQVIKSGEPINLTAKEFEILKLFFENPKRVFTKAQIFARVWDDDFLKDDNTVMVHIRKLREKLEDDPSNPIYIKTVWGIGYKLGEM